MTVLLDRKNAVLAARENERMPQDYFKRVKLASDISPLHFTAPIVPVTVTSFAPNLSQSLFPNLSGTHSGAFAIFL